jgi:hypothetical protein
MPTPSRNTTAGRVFNDLRNRGRRTGQTTDELLMAYVLERFLYRLTRSNDFTAPDVSAAVRRTADHRRIPLLPLSGQLSTLPRQRQSSYAAWRRKQGAQASAYPESFADVCTAVIAFADPLLAGLPHTAVWKAEAAAWS